MPCLTHIIDKDFTQTLRLDRYVSEYLKILTRSQIKTRKLTAKINGKDVKISRIVKQGDQLDLNWNESQPIDIIPQELPLDIVYEDERCAVINKIQGMVVHPGAGNRQGTLANALYFRRLNKGNSSSNMRAGIVHRLDKETSGIIITAYDDEANTFLADQFKNRKVKKKYIAIVCGIPKEQKGCIETSMARDQKDRKRFAVSASGKNAVTFFKVIESWCNHSLVILFPRTGRTHQLRVHMRHIGCPILGDPVYGSKDSLFPDASLMLHSKSLMITLPGKEKESVFTSDMPQRFEICIEKLRRIHQHG